MKVIKLSTDGTASELTVDDASKLVSLQRAVGGLVERLSLTTHVDLVMHEEAKFITGHRPNMIAGRLLRHFEISLAPGDYIAGDAVLVGVDGADWVSVPASTTDTLAFLGHKPTERSTP